MIFVTVGSSPIPFDRLLLAIAEFPTAEELIVQHGASTVRPAGAECIEFLGYDDFVELLRQARIVVTHAGVGSVITSLEHGRRPVVVPRRTFFGEAVDDHQMAFARRARERGLVTLVEDVDDLPSAIAEHDARAASVPAGRRAIEVELRSYLEEWVGSTGGR